MSGEGKGREEQRGRLVGKEMKKRKKMGRGGYIWCPRKSKGKRREREAGRKDGGYKDQVESKNVFAKYKLSIFKKHKAYNCSHQHRKSKTQ